LGSITLTDVVRRAFRVPGDQVVGPDWIKSQRFDIQAKLPAGASVDQVPEMLQTLLEERFGMKIHHDEKVLPIYALTLGKDGPKFHESAAGSEPDQCNGDLHKVCRQVTMEDLANILSLPYRAGMTTQWAVDRIVLDMTGLKGKYDFEMDYGIEGGRGEAGTDAVVYSSVALGLKLEPTTHTFDMIVIDHIERLPTAN